MTNVRRGAKFFFAAVVATTLTIAGGVGCGGGDHLDCSKTMLTLAASAQVVSLSPAQRGELCDYTACQLGGYGTRLSCSSGPAVGVARDRQSCVATTPTNPACQATVGDLIGCMEAVRGSPCVSTFLGGDACAAVTDFACLTPTTGALSAALISMPLAHR